MINNKVAVVTGASGGIGMAIAESLYLQDYQLVLNYNKNPDKLAAFIHSLPTQTHTPIMVKADVSSFDESSYLIETAHKNFGRIDLLVNNAGITRDKLLIQMSKNDFTDVIDTNLNGTFNCIRHVAKRMIRQKSGRIVNIASVIGLMGNIGQSNYSASKAGVIGITKSAAKELARKNITCNAIAPGFIDTEMTSDLNDEAKKNILKNIPLSCFGKPSNIADLVSFLASDKASYITGQVISVDGGLYI